MILYIVRGDIVPASYSLYFANFPLVFVWNTFQDIRRSSSIETQARTIRREYIIDPIIIPPNTIYA